MDWDELRRRHPRVWVDFLERQDNKAVDLDVTAGALAADHDLDPADRERLPDLEAAAGDLLEELFASGWVTRDVELTCRICEYPQPPGHLDGNCANPDESHDLTDQGHPGPLETRIYRRKGVRRRAIRWLLALHGMNTLGSWQETFNWLVSTSYGRMVPVAIYKYGVVRPGVLSRSRQDTLADRVAGHLDRAAGRVTRIVRDPRPDVIAHSFGTLLLGNALHRHPRLRVRRIVTLGCILRPDFDWATLVERGQVEAILNHFGTADEWAGRAHATIPDAGPAGRQGFDLWSEMWPADRREAGDRVLFNVPADGFRHSAFFDDEGESPTVLERLFRSVWRPFLTTQEMAEVAPALEKAGHRVTWPATRWRQRRWPLRAATGGWRAARFTYAARGS